MKHLFIINPKVKAAINVDEIVSEIQTFFSGNPSLVYDIHITRWARDAIGFVRKYSKDTKEILRVYAVGGGGTMYEVLNGIAGLPSVQIATFPTGVCNGMLRYFRDDKLTLFKSLNNLVFSNSEPFDIIKFNNKYALGFVSAGYESFVAKKAEKLMEKKIFPADFCFKLCGFYSLMTYNRQKAKLNINIDGESIEGSFFSVLIANVPTYGINMYSAVDASPISGMLDIYLIYEFPILKSIPIILSYVKGGYKKYPKYIKHFRAQRIEINSPSPIDIYADGECFVNNHLDAEAISYGCDFVVPQSIDIHSFPAVFNSNN